MFGFLKCTCYDLGFGLTFMFDLCLLSFLRHLFNLCFCVGLALVVCLILNGFLAWIYCCGLELGLRISVSLGYYFVVLLVAYLVVIDLGDLGCVVYLQVTCVWLT